MPGIRDVVQALQRRPGVEAVVVVGRDGLPIDSSGQGVDADSVAALLPGVSSSRPHEAATSTSARTAHIQRTLVMFSP